MLFVTFVGINFNSGGMVEKIFLQTFVVFAVWASMWETMIFSFVRDFFLTWPDKIQKPIFECPICMQSVYGSAFYWIYWGNSVKEYIVVMIACVGLSAILVKLFPPEKED
jgi:hypothetical protein